MENKNKKIAIASLGKNKDSEISSVAGRSPYYLIFDNKGKLIETVKNPFVIGGGAGFGIAKLLSDKDVNIVIAGKFGGNMTGALEEKNIKALEKKGIVEEILKEI